MLELLAEEIGEEKIKKKLQAIQEELKTLEQVQYEAKIEILPK